MATIDEQAELSHPDSTSLGSDPGRGYRDFAGGLGTSVTTASAPGTAVGCGCAACRGGSKAHTTSGFVYGLGQLDYDLVSEARRDSLQTEMDPAGLTRDPSNAKELLAHLKTNEWATASVIWTLCLDDTPIYALTPEGPYAGKLFQWFREALEGITQEKVDRVSVAGRLAGHSRLLTGQVVPNLVPDPRGFFAWKTDDLIEQAIGKKGKPGAKGAKEDPDDWKRAGIRNLIHRVYYELRNLGLTSQDRAINFAATQAFKEFEQVFEEKHKEEIELDSIQVERSPVCRPESDCWDVVLAFFFPGRPQPAVRKMFRFTIDVSDVIPVRIGLPRTWHAR